jgi:hypothetical protein
VKDTLEVSEKLNAVRGEIEQQQAEFQVLSKQIETVALNISLRAEADVQVFGLNWRPLFQLKVGARAGLDGLADYAASMTHFLFYLPTVLLWMMTLRLGAAAGWRVQRWSAACFSIPEVELTRRKPGERSRCDLTGCARAKIQEARGMLVDCSSTHPSNPPCPSSSSSPCCSCRR